jgi:protein-S-isoprenylcysteine O-methyltransferase Ste14
LNYQHLAKRLRLPLGFVFAIGYLLFAKPGNGYMTPLTLAVGLTIAAVGVVVRGWAAGHIVKNDRLATTGPYAHTRNPLYFGSFLIAAGFAIAAHWGLLLIVIAFFVLIYAPTMERERAHIRGRFPDAFAEYERNVPAFVPRPVPWRAPAQERAEPFSFDLYMRHGEWRAALVYLLVASWLAYRVSRGF